MALLTRLRKRYRRCKAGSRQSRLEKSVVERRPASLCGTCPTMANRRRKDCGSCEQMAQGPCELRAIAYCVVERETQEKCPAEIVGIDERQGSEQEPEPVPGRRLGDALKYASVSSETSRKLREYHVVRRPKWKPNGQSATIASSHHWLRPPPCFPGNLRQDPRSGQIEKHGRGSQQMHVAAGQAQPEMQENIVKRRMLVLPGAAQKDPQSMGNRSGGLVDDGAFIVDFREPAVGARA